MAGRAASKPITASASWRRTPAGPGPTLLGKGVSAADPAQNRAIRDGQTLADCIQASLITGTAATDRGIKERSLYVTHRVRGPAVLVEGGFVSNAAEAHRLGDSTYRQKIAESIAGGIMKYLGNASRQRAPLVATAATFGT